jgi:TonB-dependent receptor
MKLFKSINFNANRQRDIIFFIVMLLSIGLPLWAQSGAMGTITGKVLEKEGYELPGALVALKGTTRKSTADVNGEYRLTRVPVGKQTLVVSFMGLGSVEVEVETKAGEITEKNIMMEVKVVENVSVYGEPLLEGRARALNQQKNALNIQNVISSDMIGSFPDPNSAEATQRVPGISIQRDQGEGRYVLIRGTEARLNSMMLNGDRLPSPEGEIRSVALDVIPAGLLSAIEVSKALTPDMDADAIGGAVNLVTLNAPHRPRFNADVGLGYNDISGKTLQRGNLTFGRRFADGKVGLILGTSYYNTDFGSDNFEVEYDDGELDDLQIRDYTVNRKRIGFSTTFDVKPSPATEFKIQGVYNKFDDQEYRRRTRSRLGKERMEKEMKNRFETQTIYSIRGDLKHQFGNGIQLHAALSYSYAEEDEPDRMDTTFLQKDIIFEPNVSADSIDPDNIQSNPQNEDINKYKFDELVVENNFTSDKDWVARLDLEIPLTGSGDFSSLLKVGAKYKNKKKMRDNNVMVYESDDDIYLANFLDGNFDAGEFIDGRYDPGQFMTTNIGKLLMSSFNLEGEHDYEEDLADYTAKEDIFSGYAMAKLFFSDKFTIITGVRYESTNVDYTGKDVTFDDEGDYSGTTGIGGSNTHGLFMPGLHLIYRVGENFNVRAAFTRTLARPNYFDLVPYRLKLREDLELQLGNADLEATRSWNVDLMVEHYFKPLGAFTAGFFYKSLREYIYYFRYSDVLDGEEYNIIQPRNGDSASLWGFEVGLTGKLPIPGLSVLLNYTYTDSEAQYPDREGEKATLPGQSKHLGNVALSYERGRLSTQVALNFHGKYVDEVGETDNEDIYYDNHYQLDLSARYRFSNKISLFLEVNNVLNEPLRYYIGSSDRPIQEEYYRIRGTFGLRVSL